MEITNPTTAATDRALQTVRTQSDADGIVTVWLDQPGKSVNTLTPTMLAELSEIVAMLETQRPKGVIFASPKARSFVAGADLFEIRKMNREQVEQFLATGQQVFDRIAKLPIPTIAAINGDCLGGGLELSLACKYRVAAEDGSINIGLPEVKLGILPGWGGTVRLPRLIGLASALPLLLAGKTMPPRKASKAGIIDEVVRPEALLSAAKRIVLADAGRREPKFVQRAAASLAFARNKIFEKARQQTMELTAGNYPAPLKLIDVVKTGYEHGPAAGFDAERKGLIELTETDAAKNLMRLFFLRQASKKAIAEQIHAKAAEVKYAAVLGGGTMGAGIVHGLIRAGIQVRLIEVDPKAVSGGLSRIRKMLDDDVHSGRLSALDAKHAFNRVAPSTQWTGLELMDIVIEAVVEKMAVKKEVFAKLDAAVRPDCVLATNTSSLSVTEMAEATAHPNRVVGLHFFNPVPKMPLVEVVRTSHSDDQSLATAAGVAAKMGKTAVLVKDAPGFLVNRVLIPYLAEAVAMASEGTSIIAIDDALKRWGMPMGPFELLDEIGLDVSDHVLKSLGEQIGNRVPTSPVLEQALSRGWLGKKSGRGFYIYGDSKKKGQKPPLNQELATMLSGNPPASPDALVPAPADLEAIAWRLVLPMANEAARLLEEGVVDSTDAIDLATVLGTGLAPFRGGLSHFVDAVGTDAIASKLQELAVKHGARFEPEPLLRDLANARLPLTDFAKVEHHQVEGVVQHA
jgi:3-hydroxyacyl-CoA dehydrogenase/enoyl-CoA hydratase/3-hydroxybutyryl-CoA epimerase